jgi:hypothetical protein
MSLFMGLLIAGVTGAVCYGRGWHARGEHDRAAQTPMGGYSTGGVVRVEWGDDAQSRSAQLFPRA